MITPLDKRLLIQHVLGISREAYIIRSPIRLTDAEQRQLDELSARREAGEPVAKITGRKSFWKYEFFTSIDTLDPRPDSEWLVQAVLETYPDVATPLYILEYGTGSGCLILSLLGEYVNAKAVAIDSSQAALEMATRNAAVLQLQDRIVFHHKDWNYHWTAADESRYDVIISNPPYIPSQDIALLAEDVRKYDPMQALDGGEDGLDAYRQLLPLVQKQLRPNGSFICEIGQDQHEAVCALAENHGLSYVKSWQDLGSIPRIMRFVRSDD